MNGAEIPNVRHDLNGHGRVDYLLVHSNGSLEVRLKFGGANDGPDAAQVLLGVFEAVYSKSSTNTSLHIRYLTSNYNFASAAD